MSTCKFGAHGRTKRELEESASRAHEVTDIGHRARSGRIRSPHLLGHPLTERTGEKGPVECGGALTYVIPQT